MRRNTQGRWGLIAAVAMLLLPAATAWGYYFDDRREMSLSGFAYSRGVFATTSDNIGTFKGFYQTGNVVSHRNFLTLEWRHNLNRISREFPTAGEFFRFANFDAFDYYLNLREAYEGTWDYGTNKQRRQLDGGGGTSFFDKYFGRQAPKYAGEFARYKNFEYLTSINFMDKKINQLSLFEWYFNITKGPLFIRIGRQNLSWGETDAFRLLDQINPLDNLFGGFLVPLDERRVPLNMLRAQWSFGTVGPVSDLTLEGFVSPDRRTAAAYALNQGSFWNTPTNTSPVEVYRMPCGGPYFRRPQPNTFGDFPGNGAPCSVRAQGPHNSIKDSRGGVRVLGTVNDFTFSLASYYTWQDLSTSEAAILSPSPEHLAWDLGGSTFTALTGKPAIPANNPWGSNDPVIGAGGVKGGPGGIGTPAGTERNVWVPIREKRNWINGASLSFPVNALTGMFVGSDNPLYYLYTTFRGEFAYARSVGFREAYHDGDAPTAFQRFLSVPLTNAGVTSNANINPAFLPGGQYASEGNCQREDGTGVRGCRRGRFASRDVWAFAIGLDHNQWIRWLNPSNSFTISAQIFKADVIGLKNHFNSNKPAGLDNDVMALGIRPRSAAPTGPTTNPAKLNRPGGTGNRSQQCIPVSGLNPPCQFRGLLGVPQATEAITLSISTPYMAGNLRPSVNFFYDWAGAYLFQPGIDWTFWDPFRVSVRYNYIEGRYSGIGFSKTKDNAWIELQYLLY
jgi:Protein of unknown function (DUF1302)